MSVVLALRFPWKRYHATPWGHYVNEGLVEVPPSPWRILRALYSVWKLRAPDVDADTIQSLLEQLAIPPDYTLPPYRLSHTRHYLPDTKHRTGAPSTDLALDAFALLGGDATIHVQWPLDLTPAQDQALERLAASLPYLGRADSLCDATLERDWTRPSTPPAVPLLDGDAAAAEGMLQTGLLAPAFPFDLQALTAGVMDVRGAKLVYPLGSRILQYAVPAPERPQTPARRRTNNKPAKITAVRFSLKGTPQPRATDTIAVTDALRAACLKALAQVQGGPTGLSHLTGKDADGNPLENHQHAHYLALTDRGHINGLAIWAPGGLSDEEFAALNELARRTIGVPREVRGPRDLHVRINAYGQEDVLPENITGRSPTWVSSTPFVASRWRPRGLSPEEHLYNEITQELQYRGRRTAVKVTVLPEKDWALYRRHRWSPHHRAGKPGKTVGTRTQARPAYGLRLDFEEEVTGPISLGNLAHFGLGLFQAPDT